jgi:hypothetical protein
MSFDVDPRDRMIAALKGQIATYREQSVLDAIALGDKDAEIERLRAALQEIANLSSVSYRAPAVARRALEPKP